jgi:hypothetical protein
MWLSQSCQEPTFIRHLCKLRRTSVETAAVFMLHVACAKHHALQTHHHVPLGQQDTVPRPFVHPKLASPRHQVLCQYNKKISVGDYSALFLGPLPCRQQRELALSQVQTHAPAR